MAWALGCQHLRGGFLESVSGRRVQMMIIILSGLFNVNYRFRIIMRSYKEETHELTPVWTPVWTLVKKNFLSSDNGKRSSTLILPSCHLDNEPLCWVLCMACLSN